MPNNPATAPLAIELGGAPASPPATVKEAERRQVTLMFCDLVGSAALSDALDPEDLREVIRAYQDVASACINRHAGFIARYMGDGILVYFGYPRAQEDAAERAVRAALEMVAAVPRLRPLPEWRDDQLLQVHIGIATGLAVVGDLIGEGIAREEAVVGRTPNLAARLQGLAEPGGIVISRETRNLVANLFTLRDLGVHRLKGFTVPEPAWAVLDERPLEDRVEALRSGYDQVPLVSRVAELERLRAAWRDARDGRGQVVLLRGDPGIGKSRMTQALREHAAQDQHVVLRYYCAPRFQNTALYPIADQLKRAADLKKSDPPEVCLDKLEKLLAAAKDDASAAETVPYLAALLGIPVGDRYPPVSITPDRQRDLVFELLLSRLHLLARDQAVLMLFEDLHWIDPTSLQLLQRLIADSTSLPVLLLATSRPEFDPTWADNPAAQIVELAHLDGDGSRAIVEGLTGDKSLPEEVVQQILAKAGGVPLFLEEITKSVLESGLLQEGVDRFELTEPLPMLAVPSSLQDSLMARLDRLGRAKEVAQVGAAIGRHFTLDLLAAVSRLPEPELRPAIRRLVDSDLVECGQRDGESVCVFKHVLLQEAAQATMLRGSRRALHGRIAEELERREKRGIDTPPEVLGHHFSSARMPDRAVPYWHRAGNLASARAAYTEAIRHYRAALELLMELPKNQQRQHLELGIRVDLGLSLSAAQGYSSPEVEDTYQRARELCHTLGGAVDLFPVYRGLWAFYVVRAQLSIARELAEQCVRLGEESQLPVHLIEGYTALGFTEFHMGDPTQSRAATERSLQVYRKHDGHRLEYPTNQDPGASDLSMLSLVAWVQGNSEESLRCSREALEIADQLKRPFDLAFARCYAAMLHNMRREPDAGAEQAAQVIDLSKRHGFNIWLAAGTMHLAIAQAALGDAAQAAELLRAMLTAWEQAGAALNQPYFLAGLTEAQRRNDDLDVALVTVGQAIDHAARHRERFYDAVLFRLRGDLQLEIGGALAEQGEADLLHAIEIGRSRGARALELEARVSLHRWALRSAKPDPQLPQLEALYQDLAQDCADTPLIRDAQALLAAGG